jgi:hypothetical protein
LVWCLQFVIHIGYRNRWQFIFNSDHMQEEMSIFRIQQCREIVDDGPQSFPMGATNKEAASWAGLPQGQGRSVSRLPNAINFSVHQRWKRSALQAQVAVASSVVLATNSRCMPAKCLIKCPKLDCVVFYVLLLKIMWLAVCISERYICFE